MRQADRRPEIGALLSLDEAKLERVVFPEGETPEVLGPQPAINDGDGPKVRPALLYWLVWSVALGGSRGGKTSVTASQIGSMSLGGSTAGSSIASTWSWVSVGSS